MPTDVKDYLPRWTKRVVTSMTGRDPLGLSRVSNLITDYLLKGIITTRTGRGTTPSTAGNLGHPSGETETLEDFRTGFRRREAAMALATVLDDSDTSPTGVEATRSALDRSAGREGVDCDFQVLPSNPMGGYGQYYGGSYAASDWCMSMTRDLTGSPNLVRPWPRPMARPSRHPRTSWRPGGRARVARPILEKSAKLMTLDGLDQSAAREERALLIELFFTLQSTERNEAASAGGDARPPATRRGLLSEEGRTSPPG